MIIFYCYVRWLIPLKKSCQFWKNITFIKYWMALIIRRLLKGIAFDRIILPWVEYEGNIFHIPPKVEPIKIFKWLDVIDRSPFDFVKISYFQFLFLISPLIFLFQKLCWKWHCQFSSNFALSSGHLRRCFQGNQVMMSQGLICEDRIVVSQ